MKRIISMIIAALTMLSIFCLPVYAATKNDVPTSYSKNIIYKWETPSMEKYTIKLFAGNGSSWRVSGKVNGTGVLWCSNAKKSYGNELTVSALGEGTAYVYVAEYYTDPSTKDVEIRRMLIYKFVVAKKNGKMRFTNSIENMCSPSDAITIGSSYNRASENSFVKAKRSLSNNGVYTTEIISDGSKITYSKASDLFYKYGFRRNVLKDSHVHRYSSDKCTLCGLKRNTYLNGFPSEYYNDCPKGGKVVDVYTYKDQYYKVKIYTPYGYTKSKQYNVIFLIHGKGGSRNDWLQNSFNMTANQTTYGTMTGKKLFDWLIYKGEAAPFIAVSIDLAEYEGTYNDSILADQIVKYYLPYVAKNYSTYAKSGNLSDIETAKSHFAIAGLSRGAITVANIAVNTNASPSKYFGHKILLSAYTQADRLKALYGSSKDTLYFINGGRGDSTCQGIMKEYKAYFPKAMYIEYDSGHSWYTWFRGVSAVLQVAMK